MGRRCLGRSNGQGPQQFRTVRREAIARQFHKDSCQKLDLREQAFLGVMHLPTYCHDEQNKISLIKCGGFLNDAGDAVDVELSIFMKSMLGPAL